MLFQNVNKRSIISKNRKLCCFEKQYICKIPITGRGNSMIRYLKNPIKIILNKIINLKIRHQLIFSFVPISLLSLLVFALISYSITTKTLNNNSIAFASQSIKLINRDISKKLNDYENISSSLVLDFNLYYLLSTEEIPDMEYYTKYTSVKQRLNDIINNYEDIRSISIYPENKSSVIESNDSIFFNDLNYKETNIYKKVISDNKSKFWSTNSIGTFKRSNSSYLFLHRSLPTMSGSNGVIQMQIYEDGICNIYKGISFCKGSTVFLTDKEGVVISHTDKSRIGEKVGNTILDKLGSNLGSFKAKIGIKEFMVVYSTIDTTSWKIIVAIPMNFIESTNNRLLLISFLLIVLTFMFITFISILISSGIAKPLESIGKSMEKTEKGDFNLKFDYIGSNEIGIISQKYNSMINEIHNLLEIIRKDEKKKKESYIKVLQAQIKPHFLYNTLYSIKCLANIKKQKEIEELLDSLINLLMGSISKGGEFTSIVKEIEYVKSYVLIQAYKFKDKFRITYDIEHKIENYIILKFLLQPLVENSILHGIENQCENFVINIIGYVDNGDIVFKIRDNGKGIDRNKLGAILNNESNEYKNVFSGIGIRNVAERIKLYFGDNYSLHYNELITEGTEAVLRLPIIIDEEGIEKYA